MSIKTELKRLYTALCGGATNKDGTADIIGDIADNYTGGSGGGVTVDEKLSSTSENPVQNKAIFEKMLSKSQNIYVTFTENNGVYSCSARIADIISNGNVENFNVYGLIPVDGGRAVAPLVYVNGNDLCFFSVVSYSEDGASVSVMFGVNSNGVDTWQMIEQTVDPAKNDYKVTFTYDGAAVTANKSIAEINAAAAAGKHVYADITITDGESTLNQRFEISEYNPVNATFYAVQIDENNGTPVPKSVCIQGARTGGADVWTVVD